jgi:hypothetical protein
MTQWLENGAGLSGAVELMNIQWREGDTTRRQERRVQGFSS